MTQNSNSFNVGLICARVLEGLGNRLHSQAARIKKNSAVIDLAGDREVEWSWVYSNIPEGNLEVLDFGCGPTPIGSFVAARRGSQVTAFDLHKYSFPVNMKHVTPVVGDVLTFDFGARKYDCVINCSTIEHVGLPGRYGGNVGADSDIRAMAVLKSLLNCSGKMILTLPIGVDSVHLPFHRVYGQQRLPKLLEGWRIEKEEYWAKFKDNVWEQLSQEQVFKVKSSSKYYGLGLFVLTV